MIIRFVFVLLLSFHGLVHASEGEHIPERMHGAWEGELAIMRYESAAPVVIEDLPKSSRIKLVIGSGTVITYYLDSDTPRKPNGFLNKFDFTSTADSISGSHVASGGDKDGRWEEVQAIVLQRVDAGTLHVYWLRAVSNLDQVQESNNSKWATIKIGKLNKVD